MYLLIEVAQKTPLPKVITLGWGVMCLKTALEGV
jgi:hypothetical protein